VAGFADLQLQAACWAKLALKHADAGFEHVSAVIGSSVSFRVSSGMQHWKFC
jgi:hypothetical protein